MIHNGGGLFGSYQNRIVWIHDPKHFFTTYPRRVNSASGILELTVQNTMKDQQICNIISSRVILSKGNSSILWVVSIEMNEK